MMRTPSPAGDHPQKPNREKSARGDSNLDSVKALISVVQMTVLLRLMRCTPGISTRCEGYSNHGTFSRVSQVQLMLNSLWNDAGLARLGGSGLSLPW